MFNKTVLILVFFNLLAFASNTTLSTTLHQGEIEALESIHENIEIASSVEISPYDHIFRSISESEGNDWRLLCAMAYHESRFDSEAISRCGARGIMQVMPRVASQFDVTIEQLYNVEDNIYVANKLIVLIDQMLRLPESISAPDRLKLTLASYNCGVGRVRDARRLAQSLGDDPNRWESVANALRLMNEPEYYERNEVKYGRFIGAGETLAYVRNVVNHYETYCVLAMR